MNDQLLQATNGTLRAVATAPDGSGGILCAAFEQSNVPGDFFITVGRTDADGNALFGPTGTRIPIPDSSTLIFTDLVPDGSGGAFVAAWFRPSGGIARRFLLYRVDGQGNLTTSPNGVSVSGTFNAQSDLSMVSDDNGGLLVAWSEDRGASSDDIVVQRFSASLFKLWGLGGVVVCSASGSQRSLVIASDGSGGMIVAWTDQRSGNREVYAAKVASDVSQPWDANGVRAISSFSSSSPNPSIVSNGAGGAVISARAFGIETIGDVLLVELDATGFTANVRELTSSDGLGQTDIRVIRDGSTGYFAVWLEDPDSFPDRVRVQRLGAGLRPLLPLPAPGLLGHTSLVELGSRRHHGSWHPLRPEHDLAARWIGLRGVGRSSRREHSRRADLRTADHVGGLSRRSATGDLCCRRLPAGSGRSAARRLGCL